MPAVHQRPARRPAPAATRLIPPRERAVADRPRRPDGNQQRPRQSEPGQRPQPLRAAGAAAPLGRRRVGGIGMHRAPSLASGRRAAVRHRSWHAPPPAGRPSRFERMRSFACGHCGHLVFFENTICLNCSTPLGFDPRRLELVALEGPTAEALHRCANVTLAGCNWMVRARRRAVPVVRADPDAPQRLRRRGPGRVRQRRGRQASRDHATARARAPGPRARASCPSTCCPAGASPSPPATPTG